MMPKQLAVLRYIDTTIRETGTAPSYAEINVALGFRSRSAAHAMVERLEVAGFVRKSIPRHRGIEVLRMPGEEREIDRLRARVAELEGMLKC